MTALQFGSVEKRPIDWKQVVLWDGLSRDNLVLILIG
jgi:hypothetical protein